MGPKPKAHFAPRRCKEGARRSHPPQRRKGVNHLSHPSSPRQGEGAQLPDYRRRRRNHCPHHHCLGPASPTYF